MSCAESTAAVSLRSNQHQDERVTVRAGKSASTGSGLPPQEADGAGSRPLSPCIATGAERSKFEQLKADSAYLHDPLAEELANDANHFTDGAVQLLKFHGSYQQDNRENRQKGQDKDWQMMLPLPSPCPFNTSYAAAHTTPGVDVGSRLPA